MPAEKPQNIRQVQLPSGKVIEVVYFADSAESRCERRPAEPMREVAEARPSTDLHICPRCSSQMVFPVDWAEAGPSHWEVELRCPECEWRATGVFAQEIVERFDVELDHGSDALLRDLQHLAHANMAEEIDRFVRALGDDHVLPADF
jgi:hypothetical protein